MRFVFGRPHRLFFQAWPALVLVASSGCAEQTSEADQSANSYVICDGSASVRLGYQQLPAGVVMTGAELLIQNGFSYFFVDGSCTYWAFRSGQNDGSWQATHTGFMGLDEATQLATDLDLAHWSNRVETDGWCDASPVVLWREGAVLAWQHACNGGPEAAGQTIPELNETTYAWMDKLWNAGTPVETPMRVLAYPAPAVWDDPLRPSATLMLDLAPIAVSFEEANNFTFDDPALLLTSPAGLSELRAQRANVLAGDYDRFPGDLKIFPVRQNEILYFVYFRDTIPLEHDDGLIRPPLADPEH